MSQIDVLLLTDNSLDTIGGSEESTKILIDGLKKDYNIGVVQPGDIKEPKSFVHYFPVSKLTRLKTVFRNPLAFIRYIISVRRIINKEKPKIIHTQAQVSFFIIGLLFKLKLIPKSIKFIHTERGLYTKYSSFFKRLFFIFMKELNVLVTTTKFNMDYWKEALEEKNYTLEYKIIENTAGELFETYNPENERKDDEDLVVGFAGRYADWKNWPLAVEISEELYKQIGKNLKVRMAVGCLDERALEETKDMFKYMKDLLGNNFEGQINISLEEMDQFYYDLDFFILTSNYNTESFGRTLVEAMSRKTVVLSTDAGGPVEIINNDTNILTTADGFVKRINELYEEKDLLNLEKESNYKMVNERYSLANNISKHLSLYKTFID